MSPRPASSPSPTSSPGVLFILSLGGLSHAGDRAARQPASASSAWLIAVAVADAAARRRRRATALLVGRAGDRAARIGAVLARARRDDGDAASWSPMLHSFVGARRGARRHRDATSRRRPGSTASRRASTRSRSTSASSSARSRSPARSSRSASCAASIGSKPLLLPGRHVLNLGAARRVRRARRAVRRREPAPTASPALLADRLTVLAGVARRPPGDGDRRRRHAGRRLDAQQLLGLGGGGGRLHARQRSADHHRRARRLERRDPQLHHVPRDEPLDPRTSSSAASAPTRARRRPAAAQPAGEVHEHHRRRDGASCCATPKSVDHRARLRHGGRAGAAPVNEITDAAARARRRRALRDPPGRRAPARPHERAARRGEACRTTSCKRWTRSTTTSPRPTS